MSNISRTIKNIFLITRDTEIKNNLTVTRGEVGGTMGGRVFRNYYKGHIDKTKGESRSKGGREVWLGLGEWWGNADNCN